MSLEVVREGKSGKIEEAVSLTTMELVRQDSQKENRETTRDKLGLMIRKPNEKSTPQVGDFSMCPCESLQPHSSHYPEKRSKNSKGVCNFRHFATAIPALRLLFQFSPCLRLFGFMWAIIQRNGLMEMH